VPNYTDRGKNVWRSGSKFLWDSALISNWTYELWNESLAYCATHTHKRDKYACHNSKFSKNFQTNNHYRHIPTLAGIRINLLIPAKIANAQFGSHNQSKAEKLPQLCPHQFYYYNTFTFREDSQNHPAPRPCMFGPMHNTIMQQTLIVVLNLSSSPPTSTFSVTEVRYKIRAIWVHCYYRSDSQTLSLHSLAAVRVHHVCWRWTRAPQVTSVPSSSVRLSSPNLLIHNTHTQTQLRSQGWDYRTI